MVSPETSQTDADAAGEPSANPDELLLVGRVIKAHGVRGEVKVAPETDDPARFEAFEQVYLGRVPERARARAVEGVRHQQTKHGPLVLLKIAGVDDRTVAEQLRRQGVYAAEGDLPPLEENEAFIHDLIGLEVVNEAGEGLGTVETVVKAPAHDVFVVAREAASEPAMVPAVEEFVREVDLENNRLVVRPIKGLF